MTSSWAPVVGHPALPMRNGNHTPQFPIGLFKTDLDYVAALGAERTLPLTHALNARFAAAIAAGLADENMSALAMLQRAPAD